MASRDTPFEPRAVADVRVLHAHRRRGHPPALRRRIRTQRGVFRIYLLLVPIRVATYGLITQAIGRTRINLVGSSSCWPPTRSSCWRWSGHSASRVRRSGPSWPRSSSPATTSSACGQCSGCRSARSSRGRCSPPTSRSARRRPTGRRAAPHRSRRLPGLVSGPCLRAVVPRAAAPRAPARPAGARWLRRARGIALAVPQRGPHVGAQDRSA